VFPTSEAHDGATVAVATQRDAILLFPSPRHKPGIMVGSQVIGEAEDWGSQTRAVSRQQLFSTHGEIMDMKSEV
jgi:hypothetical protein